MCSKQIRWSSTDWTADLTPSTRHPSLLQACSHLHAAGQGRLITDARVLKGHFGAGISALRRSACYLVSVPPVAVTNRSFESARRIYSMFAILQFSILQRLDLKLQAKIQTPRCFSQRHGFYCIKAACCGGRDRHYHTSHQNIVMFKNVCTIFGRRNTFSEP